MEILDEIRSNLAANQNLTDEVKAKMFELCVLFHQKFPDVNLGKLRKNKRCKVGENRSFRKERSCYI